MWKIKFLLIIALLFLLGCSGGYNPTKRIFQQKGMQIITVSEQEIKNLYKRDIPPIDLAKEKLVISGVNRLHYGIAIIVGTLLIGLFFQNPLINRVMNIGFGIGAFLSLTALVKIFIAQYLIWFCFGAGILVLIGILYRYRHSTIFRSKKWIKSIRKSSSQKKILLLDVMSQAKDS